MLTEVGRSSHEPPASASSAHVFHASAGLPDGADWRAMRHTKPRAPTATRTDAPRCASTIPRSVRPRVLVVSYLAGDPLTPRGARTQAVVAALREHADVHVIAGPALAGRRSWWHRLRDRALSELGSRWLVDPLEPWAWKALGRRSPDADLALLVGYPFSPLVVAARALGRAEVPYVLDLSDPWALTRAGDSPPTWRERRSATLEHRLWTGASAGIVTTAGQARDLLARVPSLDVLVRPNGYAEVTDAPTRSRRPADDELRIGHFGNLYGPRVAIAGFLRGLAESGRWRRVVLRLYGSDGRPELGAASSVVTVESCRRVPWPQAVRLAAAELDVALVVGNTDVRQLPSKAIEYLTLPVPRLALSSGLDGDALADYVDDRPGWLALTVGDSDPATPLWEHVERDWSREELAPPPEESWTHVAQELASYVLRSVA